MGGWEQRGRCPEKTGVGGVVERIQQQGENKIKRNKRAEREKERVSNKQARRRLTPQWEVMHMKNRR